MIEPYQKYRHYKGGLYVVLRLAKHTETSETLVIYQNLEDETKIWARPLTMFQETVNVEGVTVPRFSLIQDVDNDL